MWDKYFWPGLKAGGWFRKGLCCMHWHGREARSVILALISAGTLLMPQTHRYVCVGCEERGTLACAIPSVRATKTYIVKSPACQAAGLPSWASRNLRRRQDRLTLWWEALPQQAQCLTCCTNRPVDQEKDKGYTIHILCIIIYN